LVTKLLLQTGNSALVDRALKLILAAKGKTGFPEETIPQTRRIIPNSCRIHFIGFDHTNLNNSSRETILPLF